MLAGNPAGRVRDDAGRGNDAERAFAARRRARLAAAAGESEGEKKERDEEPAVFWHIKIIVTGLQKVKRGSAEEW